MSPAKSTIEHPEWGTIIVARNKRARRIILYPRPDGIHITVPAYATDSDIERALAECGERLKEMQEKHRAEAIGEGFTINAERFTLHVRQGEVGRPTLTGLDGAYTVICPPSLDYSTTDVQSLLKRLIKGALRHRAKHYLTLRLKELAGVHGFRYGNSTVRDVHSRWGSCSTRGDISLSIYLMLLPERLIDYVLLHELCHTVEMNHSERFWKLLDQCTAPACAKELRKELKGFRNGLL